MNNTEHRNTVVMIVDIVATGVSLGILVKRLENNSRCHRKYLKVKRKGISDWNGHCKKEYHRFRRSEKKNYKKHYAENIKQLRYLLDEAYQQMQQGQFRYALYDADCVMRETIKMMVQHENGGDILDDLLMNMKICEREQLFGTDKDFINRLYEVYHICECDGLEFNKGKHINHRKVYFVIMQVKDLLNFAEKRIIYA